MEIIPVIDVMGGKVVRASGGNRESYPLLQSCLTESYEPIGVIKDLLAFYSFSIIYIADLDAISDGKFDEQRYYEISSTFPNIEFWLDAGIKTQTEWQKVNQYFNIRPVIGSETLLEPLWLKEPLVSEKSILSLDFQKGHFLGNKALLSDPVFWPKSIIVMNLDCIGSQLGPDFNLLKQIQLRTENKVIASGGVRGPSDLLSLKEKGIKQALVASVLHDGRLAQEDVFILSES
ncbi:HisA/HisF-related TIM barrel protein [Pseudomonadota bacterium]|nr:HisA/HisF-related TIM barrel protein [Pseudomonadota bacterium]